MEHINVFVYACKKNCRKVIKNEKWKIKKEDNMMSMKNETKCNFVLVEKDEEIIT